MNRCTWTDLHMEKRMNGNKYLVQCENMTDEQFDEYGRAYCEIHRIKVDEINKSRHKNCINKEKLISFLSEFYNSFNQVEDKWFQSKADSYANILEKIKNGDFDNE